MANKNLISKKVDQFYTKSSEEDRLTFGLGPFEFERNKQLIENHLPKHKAVILDIGGGTGKYSEWLANLGHAVTLVEPIEKHLKLAKQRARKLQNPFVVLKGEARNVEVKSNSVDLVILHGPLYHLQEKEDRLRAILEAKRICKPQSWILGFAINYTASTFVALLQGMLHEPAIFDMCTTELTSGLHNAPENMPGVLDDAFYHRPEELKNEFMEAGLSENKIKAVEGIAWLEKNFFTTRASQSKYENLKHLMQLTQSDENLLAVSPHMMIAGKK